MAKNLQFANCKEDHGSIFHESSEASVLALACLDKTVDYLGKCIGQSMREVSQDFHFYYSFVRFAMCASILLRPVVPKINQQDGVAGKGRREVSPDLPDYIMNSEVSDVVRTALRTAKDYGATAEDWQQFVEKIKRKKQEK
jgi:hypothetical protein